VLSSSAVILHRLKTKSCIALATRHRLPMLLWEHGTEAQPTTVWTVDNCEDNKWTVADAAMTVQGTDSVYDD